MRGFIYDKALLPLTSGWYAEVIRRLEPGARLLDVGIGTGGALAKNAAAVRQRSITVVGVDIDAAYVQRSERVLEEAGLSEHVQVHLQSIYDHEGGPYDAVYFSASFMLMPDPPAVLRHVASLLSDEGRIFFTQTFQDRPSPMMERAKPLLRKLTTIDFGTVTYEADFRSTLAEGDVRILELATLGQSGPRSYRLAVGVPEAQIRA